MEACQNGVEMASTVILTTFDEDISAQVPMNEKAVLAEDFLLTVGKTLGLKRSSVQFFGIFQGLLHPTQKFKSIDPIPMDIKDLTFQKWCFDSSKEAKLLKDPVATQLVYAQCRVYIQNGLLKPVEELHAKLKGNDDPSTAAEYVALCHGIPGYNSIHLAHCTLHETFGLLPDVAVGTSLCLSLLRRGMVLRVIRQADAQEKEEYFVSWRKIQRWRKSEADQRLVTYDVYSVPSEDHSCLCVQTTQANYLLSATMEMIKGLQTELKGPVFQTSDLIRNRQREVIEWNNIVYSPTRFNAEREIAEAYVELSMLR